jgi:predicted phage tail protein
VGAAGEAVSNVASVRAIPSGLGALTFTRTAAPVVLKWGDASAETSYQVQRSPNVATPVFATIATLAANTVTYTDNTAVASSSYVYRVLAINASGQVVSNSVTVPVVAVPAPLAPTSLNGNKTNVNRSLANITLTWRAPATGTPAASYIIQSCSGPTNCTNFTQLATTTSLTYTVRNVNRGTPFSFRVQSVSASGVKSIAFSNVFGVTP